MGVHKFAKFYSDVMLHKSNTRLVSEFKGKIVVVDANHRIYKQCISRHNNGQEIFDSAGKNVTHVISTYIFVIGLLESGIQPFFVFDGRAPTEKTVVLEERKEQRQSSLDMRDKIEDVTSEEYIKHDKKCFYINKTQFDECRMLLNCMGIPYLDAISEADQQCAVLSAFYNDRVAGVVTDDTDILVFGGTSILKNFSMRDRTTIVVGKQSILTHLLCSANVILEKNNMPRISKFSHDKFVDFSILMGTDYRGDDGYSCHITGFTNQELFEIFVLKNFEMERLVDELSSHIVDTEKFIQTWKSIRKIYLTSDVIDPSTVKITMNKPNIEKLYELLNSVNSINRSHVSHNIKTLMNNYEVFNNITHRQNRFENFNNCQHRHYSRHSHIKLPSDVMSWRVTVG